MRLRRLLPIALCAGLAVAPGCRCGREAPPARGAAAPDVPAVLATLAAGEGAPGPDHPFHFGERGGGVAWVVEKDGKSRVFHDGRAGRAYEAVGTPVLSRDGRRVAHGALAGGKWRLVVDGEEGAAFDEVDQPLFSPDGSHVAHLARVGERWHVVVDGVASEGIPGRYAMLAFSGDSSRIAFVEGEGPGSLVVIDLASGKRTIVDERVRDALPNADGTRLAAVSEEEGGQRARVVSFDRPEGPEKGPRYDAVHGLAFGPDGRSLAYFAERAGERFAVLEGREAPLPPGDSPVAPPAVRPDGRGVGIVVVTEGAVFLRELLVEGARPEGPYQSIDWLVYGGEGGAHAYAARKGERWHAVVNGKEGPPFDRVVTPAFSPDGKLVAYRARQDGKRFVVVADLDGRTVRRHSSYEQVHPVVFTPDGTSVAYGVKDGRQLAWKVEPL